MIKVDGNLLLTIGKVVGSERRRGGEGLLFTLSGKTAQGGNISLQLRTSLIMSQMTHEPRESERHRPLLMHSPSPHCSWPSGQTGSSVTRLGRAMRGFVSRSQLSTWNGIKIEVNCSNGKIICQRFRCVPAQLSTYTDTIQLSFWADKHS